MLIPTEPVLTAGVTCRDTSRKLQRTRRGIPRKLQRKSPAPNGVSSSAWSEQMPSCCRYKSKQEGDSNYKETKEEDEEAAKREEES